MASAAVPSGRSLLGKFAGLAAARARAKGTTSRVASLISEHLLTVAALSAGVADGFIHGPAWGLGALAGALLILDFKLQG